ncbi:MAG: CPXCG motif-containing cysteine-rich protein [Opitutaceae bacterium]
MNDKAGDAFEAAENSRFVDVQCPACFEIFQVAAPAKSECPAEWDYDCEVCCRPMFIHFSLQDGDVYAEARSLDD